MAPHSSTLAWKIPWMEEPGRMQSMGSRRREESDTTEQLHFHFSLSCIGEGNGNSLQCSCLENPRDGGAWWAAVYGVTQSQTRLKRLSTQHQIVSKGHVEESQPGSRAGLAPWSGQLIGCSGENMCQQPLSPCQERGARGPLLICTTLAPAPTGMQGEVAGNRGRNRTWENHRV